MAEGTSRSGKKVVQAKSAPKTEKAKIADEDLKKEAERRVREGEGWKASEADKKSAGTKRLIAWILWIVAIVIEGVAIWYLLTQVRGTNVDGEPIPQPDWLIWALIGVFVVIGALTIIGSQLWKAANQADPASRQDGFRFFVQNQLGAFIPIIAFLPLIIVILLNKNIDGKTKGIAGAVGVVLLIVASLLGIEWNPNSQEGETQGQIVAEGQSDEYAAIVVALTGEDNVAWTPAGKVYHLCTDASAVQRESAANEIRVGTVADAHADGKIGLTLQVDQELDQCGLAEPGNLDELEAEIRELRDAYEEAKTK